MSRASHITNIVENRVRLQGPRIVGTICALFFLCGIGSVEQAGAQGVDSTITPVLDLFVADTNVVRSDWSFALTVGAQINLHAASFSTLPEVPSCCPNYTGKATLGATGGIEIRRAVEEQLAIELGLTYGTMGILFAAEETVVVFDGTGPADAVFAYALDADLAGLFIEPSRTGSGSSAEFTQYIEEYKKGDLVVAFGGWQDYSISDGVGLIKLNKDMKNPSYALGVLGMPGLIAPGLLDPDVYNRDMYVMLGLTLLLFLFSFKKASFIFSSQVTLQPFLEQPY